MHTRCNTMPHNAIPCHTLQHPASPCKILQHPATLFFFKIWYPAINFLGVTHKANQGLTGRRSKKVRQSQKNGYVCACVYMTNEYVFIYTHVYMYMYVNISTDMYIRTVTHWSWLIQRASNTRFRCVYTYTPRYIYLNIYRSTLTKMRRIQKNWYDTKN